MSISNTYLNQYKKIISMITKNVNDYFIENDVNFENDAYIQPSFFLQFLANKDKFYNEIVIYQKNRKRILHEPILELKYIQKYILHVVLYREKKYKFDKCVTGFIKNKSIINNATPHLNKVAIIKMDIKDFFPSITRTMVYNTLKKYNEFSYEYAYILSHLGTFNNSLPQGAPTSPFFANICAKGIDFKINKLIKVINKRQKMNIDYTRYADDITISFDKKFNYDYIINTVTDIIFDEGFYPNFKKCKIIKNNSCQKVTGIVVNNEVPSIEKKEREKIKFILNIWDKYGIESAILLWNKHKFGKIISEDDKTKKMLEVLNGKITYFIMVNKNQNIKLQEKFTQLYDNMT